MISLRFGILGLEVLYYVRSYETSFVQLSSNYLCVVGVSEVHSLQNVLQLNFCAKLGGVYRLAYWRNLLLAETMVLIFNLTETCLALLLVKGKLKEPTVSYKNIAIKVAFYESLSASTVNFFYLKDSKNTDQSSISQSSKCRPFKLLCMESFQSFRQDFAVKPKTLYRCSSTC